MEISVNKKYEQCYISAKEETSIIREKLLNDIFGAILEKC